TRGSTMAGPPSLEEAVGGLAQQGAELVPQRLGQVGVDLRGAQARMAEQDLDDPDVHAPLEHVRGEAVTQRVRPEIGVKALSIYLRPTALTSVEALCSPAPKERESPVRSRDDGRARPASCQINPG